MNNSYLIAYTAIVRNELRRVIRLWVQTLLPPVITMSLYFVIFGNLMGSRIGQMDGVSYIAYIAPGLIMISVINNSYLSVSTSFYLAKFQRCIEEILVAPVPVSVILLGYITGGVLRGLITGVLVLIVSMFFAKITLHHLGVTLITVFLTAGVFSLAGLINAMLAKNFDGISFIPTFILTPLTYLGGVFYSIDLLPPLWHGASLANPILYMVNAFRYGILGVSDIKISFALLLLSATVLIFYIVAHVMLKKGVGIKT